MDAILNASGKPVLQRIVKGIQDNKAYLSEVDGLIGDGDHGMNMNKGFTVFGERIAGREVTLSEGLEELGMVLLNEIGGSMGPIYGTIFMEMSDKADDTEEITLPLFADMLDAALEGLYGIVDARPGDKTLVDTLYPALQALKAAIAEGKSFAEALDNLKAEAEKGKESTKEMVAKYGRSARLGERSRGVLDAGATSCCIILQAMADGMKKVLED
jgi:dihydroxyacetone kinase-like protein